MGVYEPSSAESRLQFGSASKTKSAHCRQEAARHADWVVITEHLSTTVRKWLLEAERKQAGLSSARSGRGTGGSPAVASSSQSGRGLLEDIADCDPSRSIGDGEALCQGRSRNHRQRASQPCSVHGCGGRIEPTTRPGYRRGHFNELKLCSHVFARFEAIHLGFPREDGFPIVVAGLHVTTLCRLEPMMAGGGVRPVRYEIFGIR